MPLITHNEQQLIYTPEQIPYPFAIEQGQLLIYSYGDVFEPVLCIHGVYAPDIDMRTGNLALIRLSDLPLPKMNMKEKALFLDKLIDPPGKTLNKAYYKLYDDLVMFSLGLQKAPQKSLKHLLKSVKKEVNKK